MNQDDNADPLDNLPARRKANVGLTIAGVAIGISGFLCIAALPFLTVPAAPVSFFAGVALLAVAVFIFYSSAGQTVDVSYSRYGAPMREVRTTQEYQDHPS